MNPATTLRRRPHAGALALAATLGLTLALAAPSPAGAQDFGLETEPALTYSGYLRAEPFYRHIEGEGASGEAGRFELQSMASWRPADALEVRGDLALNLQSNMGLLGEGEGTSRLAINEAYVDVRPGGGVSLIAGKRKAPWGVGLTARPTDLLNPEPNPFEPTLQREGAWMIDAQYAWAWGALDLVYAPTVDESDRGWPDDVHIEPDESTTAARLAVTVAETDLSALYYRERGQHRVGLTAVRYVTADLELHAEVLLRDDSPTPIELPPLALDLLEIDVDAPSVEALAGGRYWEPASGLELTAEYQYLGAGLDGEAFDRAVELRETFGGGVGNLDGAPTSTDAIAPLRQHYLTVQVRRVKFDSDLTPGLGARVGLADGGVLLFPSIDYRLADATTLGAGAYVLLAPDGSEFDQSPLDWAAFGRLTAYF